jgi:hypothetical protein
MIPLPDGKHPGEQTSKARVEKETKKMAIKSMAGI